MITTWRALLEDERAKCADPTPFVAFAVDGEQLSPHDTEWMDVEFDEGYGIARGAPFTAWSETRVYFPVVYDGAEWAGSVPRNPSAETSEHSGGQ